MLSLPCFDSSPWVLSLVASCIFSASPSSLDPAPSDSLCQRKWQKQIRRRDRNQKSTVESVWFEHVNLPGCSLNWRRPTPGMRPSSLLGWCCRRSVQAPPICALHGCLFLWRPAVCVSSWVSERLLMPVTSRDPQVLPRTAVCVLPPAWQ